MIIEYCMIAYASNILNLLTPYQNLALPLNEISLLCMTDWKQEYNLFASLSY